MLIYNLRNVLIDFVNKFLFECIPLQLLLSSKEDVVISIIDIYFLLLSVFFHIDWMFHDIIKMFKIIETNFIILIISIILIAIELIIISISIRSVIVVVIMVTVMVIEIYRRKLLTDTKSLAKLLLTLIKWIFKYTIIIHMIILSIILHDIIHNIINEINTTFGPIDNRMWLIAIECFPYIITILEIHDGLTGISRLQIYFSNIFISISCLQISIPRALTTYS